MESAFKKHLPAFDNNPVQHLLIENYKKHGSVGDMIARTKLNTTTLNRLMNGIHLPSMEVFTKICVGLELKSDEVLDLIHKLSKYLKEKKRKSLIK
jgi:hypothetical protein